MLEIVAVPPQRPQRLAHHHTLHGGKKHVERAEKQDDAARDVDLLEHKAEQKDEENVETADLDHLADLGNQVFPPKRIVQTKGMAEEKINRNGHRRQLHIVREMDAALAAEHVKTDAERADHCKHAQQRVEDSEKEIKNFLVFLDHRHSFPDGPADRSFIKKRAARTGRRRTISFPRYSMDRTARRSSSTEDGATERASTPRPRK